MSMDPQKKKLLIVGGVIAVVIIVGIFVFFAVEKDLSGGGNGQGQTSNTAGNTTATSSITNITLNRSAYQIALGRAEVWQPDAALMKMISADNTGNDWDFTFVSPKNKGKALEVVVDGQTVASTTQIAIVGGGTALPTNLISPDDAIAEAHNVPGYANATIVSVELVYNAAGNRWYWGMKTATGATLTVKATP